MVLLDQLAAETKANLLAMEKIWDNGFRQTTTSTKPIQSPDDFRGMKLRVPPSPPGKKKHRRGFHRRPGPASSRPSFPTPVLWPRT